MRVRQGENIVCSRGTRAGKLLRDVEDGSAISGEDFSVASQPLQDDRGYASLKCGIFVALHVGEARWRIRTSHGWIE
jgi:hypothetical protein